MFEVTVFVDDAVRGRLPRVCAKDGVPTADRLRVVTEVVRSSQLGILWLLLLAGPLGWIALALVAATRGGAERLTVEVPLGEEAYRRFVGARRLRVASAVVAMLTGLALVLTLINEAAPAVGPVVAVAVTAAALVVVANQQSDHASVGVSLDASRRWVTLHRVHPEFAAACRGAVGDPLRSAR